MRTLLLLLLTAYACWGQPFLLNDPALVGQQVNAVPAGWSPTNAYGWWYAGSLTANNGDLITNWTDSAGSHPLYSLGGGTTKAPYFTNSLINSLPALYFNNKAVTNALGVTIAQPMTFFVVAQVIYDGNSLAGYFWDNGNGVTRNIFSSNPDGNTNFFFGIYAGTAWQKDSLRHTNQIWCLYTVCYNGSTSFVRTNGTLMYQAGGTPGSDGFSKMTIGGHYDGTGSAFRGWIAELLLYNGLPATNDMQWVESNLKTKYGL